MSTDTTEARDADRHYTRERIRIKRKRRHRRRRILIALAVLAAAAILVLLTILPARAARDRLVEARGHIREARTALSEGDIATASEAFEASAVSFIQATEQARNPMLRLAGVLPILGRTPDTLLAISESGGEVAEAGVELAEALERIPGGLSGLAPQDGQIPKEPLTTLAPGLRDASILVRAARDRVASLPHSWILSDVAAAREELGLQLDELAPRLEAAALLVDRLPAFFGYDGERRYFFGASNPAEARGTGGLIGAYSILTADQGRLAFSEFRPVNELPSPPADVLEPPNPDYEKRYPGAWTFWLNINMTPDFPSVGGAIEDLYEYVEGERLDGTIIADPFALESLMAVTGPVGVSELGRSVQADDIVAVTTNQAYAEITDPAARKHILGNVARTVVERFLQDSTTPEAFSRAMMSAGSGGHLQIHSADREMQRGLARLEVGGALLRTENDHVGLAFNNGAGNKVDFYAHSSLEYSVRLGAAGTARSRVTVSIENQAPTSGPPPYVIGPHPGVSDAGENITHLSMFFPGSAFFEGAELDGVPDVASEGEELGHLALERTLEIPSGETGSLSYSIASPNAWEGDAGEGTYRLDLQLPPTMNPIEASVDIETPGGTEIVWTSAPMDVSGNRARWSGLATSSQSFQVRFQAPFLSRIWQRIADFFSRPLLTF